MRTTQTESIDGYNNQTETEWKVKNTIVYRVLECGSDHFLLVTKIHIPFKSQTRTKKEIKEDKIEQLKYNLNGLYDDSTRTLFQTRLDMKLEGDLRKHITEAIHSAAYEDFGEDNHTKHHQKR